MFPFQLVKTVSFSTHFEMFVEHVFLEGDQKKSNLFSINDAKFHTKFIDEIEMDGK